MLAMHGFRATGLAVLVVATVFSGAAGAGVPDDRPVRPAVVRSTPSRGSVQVPAATRPAGADRKKASHLERSAGSGGTMRTRVRMPDFRQTWITQRYHLIAGEARRQEQTLNRTRTQIDRQLSTIYRARFAMLNHDRTAETRSRADPVIVQVEALRRQLRSAVSRSRKTLRGTLTQASKALREIDRSWPAVDVRRPSRIASRGGAAPRAGDPAARRSGDDPDRVRPAEARADRGRTRTASPRPSPRRALARQVDQVVSAANQKIQAVKRSFAQVIVGQRQAIAGLARTNRQQAQRALASMKLSPRPSGKASSPDTHRTLTRLLKMENARRKALEAQLRKDARKIQELKQEVSGLERRLRAIEKAIRQLKEKKTKSAGGEKSSSDSGASRASHRESA